MLYTCHLVALIVMVYVTFWPESVGPVGVLLLLGSKRCIFTAAYLKAKLEAPYKLEF